MRFLMLIMVFFMLPNVFFAQQTYVPDDNFEQALIDLGYDEGLLNDSVPTANIESVAFLNVYGKNISDLTGIEEFKALERLICVLNNLISLDMSNNTALKRLYCSENNLASLDVRNGNNKNMVGAEPNYKFDARNNPDLYCIQVDDSVWSANAEKWKKDDHAHYSEDCGYTGVEEFLSTGTEISIFPNPAGKNFTVSFELETPQTLTMTLTDLSGNELQEFTLENKQYVNEEIDVSGLSSGVYFLSISFGNESITRKIVVK